MPRYLQIISKVRIGERVLIALILFYAGLVLCLPVPSTEEVALLYPWWAKPIGVGKIYLQELLFIIWVFIYGRRFLVRGILNSGVPTRQAALLLIILALWCGLVSLTAPLPWLDIGRTFRLLLNVLLLLAVVRWSYQMNDFPIGMLILGFFVGTIINLILSFQYPLVVYGMMRLSGQNTPGVVMGVAVHLTAWLFFHNSNRLLKGFSLLFAFVFFISCIFSYSRIGWFAAGTGLIVWGYILFIAKPKQQSQLRSLNKLRIILTPLLVLGLVSFFVSPIGQQGVQQIQALVQQKISQQGESNSIRWAYVTGTAEILLQHPLGVGYSGFYDAILATETYRDGKSAEEVSMVEANPHASFLWYASAGGIPGAFLSLVLFIMLINSMQIGLKSSLGQPGKILFIFLAPVYLVIGMTVPYLFNSIILIVPAAIAAGWGWSMRESKMMFLHRHPHKMAANIIIKSRNA